MSVIESTSIPFQQEPHSSSSNHQQYHPQHPNNNSSSPDLRSYSFPPQRSSISSTGSNNFDRRDSTTSSTELVRGLVGGTSFDGDVAERTSKLVESYGTRSHEARNTTRSNQYHQPIETEPSHSEYSSVEAHLYSGRQKFSFSEYISESREENTHGGESNERRSIEGYHESQTSNGGHHLGYPGSRFHAPALLLRRPSLSSNPYSFAPPPPQVHQYQWNSYSQSSHQPTTSSPCCSNPEPHSHFAPPPPSGTYNSDLRLQFGRDNSLVPYHSPHGLVGLARSISNQSSVSAQSNSTQGGNYSDSDRRTGSPFEDSDQGGNNPNHTIYVHPGHGVTPSTHQRYQQHHQQHQQMSPATPTPSIYGQNGGAGHYVYGSKESARIQEHNLDDLELGGGDDYEGEGEAQESENENDFVPSTPKAKPQKKPTRPITKSNIFHPTPASMLAPGSQALTRSTVGKTGKSLPPPFPGTNSPGLPSDADFAKMPTKRSRGRRPPSTPDLGIVDTSIQPTEEQLRYCGVTKTGKPKKIFLCKVPGCGKCFKRSEHLKRHVRSIHTNEKPFQCRWPNCGKLFSRHDNLSQHAAGLVSSVALLLSTSR